MEKGCLALMAPPLSPTPFFTAALQLAKKPAGFLSSGANLPPRPPPSIMLSSLRQLLLWPVAARRKK